MLRASVHQADIVSTISITVRIESSWRAARVTVVISSPNSGVFAVTAAGVLSAFPAWWAHYLNNVSAADLVQVSLSLLF
jgi:hypothetical protein